MKLGVDSESVQITVHHDRYNITIGLLTNPELDVLVRTNSLAAQCATLPSRGSGLYALHIEDTSVRYRFHDVPHEDCMGVPAFLTVKIAGTPFNSFPAFELTASRFFSSCLSSCVLPVMVSFWLCLSFSATCSPCVGCLLPSMFSCVSLLPLDDRLVFVAHDRQFATTYTCFGFNISCVTVDDHKCRC